MLQMHAGPCFNVRMGSRVREQDLMKGDQSVKFYAGMPLVASDGHTIGVL